MPIEKGCKLRIARSSFHQQKYSWNNFHSMVDNVRIDTIGDSWNSSQEKIFAQAVGIVISVELNWLFFQLVYLVVLAVYFGFGGCADYVAE